ncbi:cupin domain-containing protein [Geodermatophilus sp. YIM 151500]|uniref:cupin domain-containing protein n=1 Tax=Geodermatophilus sp. YIM 151500 TaxID=2984531 RepID=UPI0021E4170B|nr:cupin domain-containing protein [Geodermatophilus sp. YIM 151500]MCV2490802.1 cupin domain-containing protein [Geodermatophilus sp. YIM 151500]
MTDCRIIRASDSRSYAGKQGLDYFEGVSRQSCGAEGLCLHLLVLPPGAEARAHLHEAHESAIYVLEGSASMRHGPDLERLDTVGAGDFVYIPAGVPHQPFNPTDHPVRALIARTDPNEQESVVLL